MSTRHQFQGYKQEFQKIQANHNTRIEREELLRGSGISAGSSLNSSNSGLSRRDMYLKESSHLHGCVSCVIKLWIVTWFPLMWWFHLWLWIHIVMFLHKCRSHGLVNDQISIAMETKEHLMSQRHQFKRFQTRLNDISNRFPLISRFAYQRFNRIHAQLTHSINLSTFFSSIFSAWFNASTCESDVIHWCWDSWLRFAHFYWFYMRSTKLHLQFLSISIINFIIAVNISRIIIIEIFPSHTHTHTQENPIMCSGLIKLVFVDIQKISQSLSGEIKSRHSKLHMNGFVGANAFAMISVLHIVFSCWPHVDSSSTQRWHIVLINGLLFIWEIEIKKRFYLFFH